MTPDVRDEMERCRREGMPRPESSAIRAHVPAGFRFFANSWRDTDRNGILDHGVKELCRLYVSRAPRFGDAHKIARSKACPDDWAKAKPLAAFERD
jgi:hypothetical protein